MLEIKVLGSGCRNCETTTQRIEEAARAAGVNVHVDKIRDMQAIVGYGVLATPGVVIDGRVVHAGGVPTREKIDQWLAAAQGPAASMTGGGCGCGR